MEEEFPALVQSFLGETATMLEQLAAAIADADAESVYRISPSLKSSAGNMGAAQLAELARRIEQQGRAGSIAGLESLVEEATTSFAAVREFLATHLRHST